jgi:MFS family permease
MSFKLFVYYCAIVGGWAAYLAWAIVQGTGLRTASQEGRISTKTYAALTGALLGVLVAGAIGLVDAIMNAVGFQRVVRVLVCMGVGFLGGLIGGFLGEVLYQASQSPVLLVIGWILAGTAIGASIGVFDILRAATSGENARAAIKKTLNGVYGGFLGGFLGGLPFGALLSSTTLPRSNLTIGLVILGLCIGLFIGIAQVVLKEAWVKVEAGFRAGRELLLTKDETTIGRAESCDLGMFGDMTIEKLHASILLKNGRYLLQDSETPGGTWLNDKRVEDKPVPLKNGDIIRVGKSLMRFGERAKRT